MTGSEPIFTKLALLRQLFVRNCYRVFHELAENGLSAEGMSFTDGSVDSRCGLHTKRSFFLLQECLKQYVWVSTSQKTRCLSCGM
jgi:hypothetical protein